MPPAILLTQCLQNDFIEPIGKEDRLPCDLHIGWSEARRLVGENPAEGPLLAFLESCYRAAQGGKLAVVHLCDWHDAADPAQKDELEFYGLHCLQGTRGAELIAGIEGRGRDIPNVHVIRSIAINDFEDTELPGLLRRLAADVPRQQVRLGVIGVWTDVKVHYLLYDLKTRGHFHNLAVCSALTASRSRQDHFRALESLRGSLRVAVIDSTAEFQEWLGLEKTAIYGGLRLPDSPLPAVSTGGSIAAGLNPEQQRIVKNLFAHCGKVDLQPLAGGFSGSKVFMTRSRDKDGYEEVPFVIKMDRRAAIAQERVQFEQIENLLGNNAPQLKAWIELEEQAGLKYLYAGMGLEKVQTFKRFFESLSDSPADLARLEQALREVLEGILIKLYRNAGAERLQLFRYYMFRPEYADNFLRRMEGLVGEVPDGETFRLPGVEGTFPSPVSFYRARFERQLAAPPRDTMVSWVHGDLNTANILLDQRGNFWIIDFIHAKRGHVLNDIAKLENDIKFILTPLNSAEDLSRAAHFEELLLKPQSLKEDLLPLPPDLAADPGLSKTHRVLAVLRWFAGQIAGDIADMEQYRPALLRYSAHTLAFDESNEWQKKYALISTGMLCRRIHNSEIVPA